MNKDLRRKAVGFAIYAVVSIILVVALANFAAEAAKVEQTTFGPADNGKVVNLWAGAMITLELPENPSTGYAWYYSIDSRAAQVIEDNFIPAENPILGASGTRLLRLKILESGEIKLNYERWWEKQPAASFNLIVKV